MIWGPLGLRGRILAWYGGTVFTVLAPVLLSVHLEVGRETSRLVAAQMDTTRQVVESLTEERTAALAVLARLAGSEPRLGAVMGTDPATIADVLSRDLNPGLEADFLRVTDEHGRVSADTSGRVRPGADLSRDEAVRAALAGKAWRGMFIVPGEIDLVATAPIRAGGQDLGTVTLGRRVSDEMADQLHRNTNSQVTLLAGGQIAASSWPAANRPGLLCALHELRSESPIEAGSPLRFTMAWAGHRRVCLLSPLSGQGDTGAQLLIQSNLDEALRPYTNIQRVLVAIGLIGLLISALGSMIVANAVMPPPAAPRSRRPPADTARRDA
jgi:hypothetical protein